MTDEERWQRVLQAHQDEHVAMRERGLSRHVTLSGRSGALAGGTLRLAPMHVHRGGPNIGQFPAVEVGRGRSLGNAEARLPLWIPVTLAGATAFGALLWIAGRA